MGVFRVLQVFTVMNRGGAESMIMNYYRKLDKSRIQFDFLVHRKNRGAFDDEIEEMGGNIYRFDAINPLFPNKYYKELRAFLNQHNEYRIIHSHLNTFSCFPLKIAEEFGIPCRIAHAHIAIDKVNIFSLFKSKESKSETIKKIIKLQLKKRIKNHATHFLSCGQKAGEWLFDNSPFTTMNNAIDTESFLYDKTIEAAYKEKLGLCDELVLGHIGRFVSQKNHEFLLKIFEEVLNKKENVSLVLIGDGPLRSNIEQAAKKMKVDHKIQFLGVRPDIPKLCQMLHFFVFPSFYEGLPVTLIEAQASGLKILASDTITKEVELTSNIKFLSIQDSPRFWADQILNSKGYEKQNTKEAIVKGGYDIISNTRKIEEFYLKQISK
ncbi:glycosyltransferase family 1 protein [Aquimarina sp. 2201CG1-2-11]|uniref:glycosyltransferase family 1 protein n=1 Tax=Aquimarina discodermiae TaxID=3231043 RepID=UPI003462B727